jgi:hypothetical protein
MAVRLRPVSEEIRPMDDLVIDTHLENIDRRLTKLEQILPTLATKAELETTALAAKRELQEAVARLATKEGLRLAIAPLATKEELRLAIAAAVAPLATKAEVQEFRRHMDILLEALRGDIQLLAEHVATVMRRPRK